MSRDFLEPIRNPSGEVAYARQVEQRFQRLERAHVTFTLKHVKPPKKAPNASVVGSAVAERGLLFHLGSYSSTEESVLSFTIENPTGATVFAILTMHLGVIVDPTITVEGDLTWNEENVDHDDDAFAVFSAECPNGVSSVVVTITAPGFAAIDVIGVQSPTTAIDSLVDSGGVTSAPHTFDVTASAGQIVYTVSNLFDEENTSLTDAGFERITGPILAHYFKEAAGDASDDPEWDPTGGGSMMGVALVLDL